MIDAQPPRPDRAGLSVLRLLGYLGIGVVAVVVYLEVVGRIRRLARDEAWDAIDWHRRDDHREDRPGEE